MPTSIGPALRTAKCPASRSGELVLSDTIEGKIFLLLNDTRIQIAKTLGNVDEHGEVAEDLRTPILGQLSERLNWPSIANGKGCPPGNASSIT